MTIKYQNAINIFSIRIEIPASKKIYLSLESNSWINAQARCKNYGTLNSERSQYKYT